MGWNVGLAVEHVRFPRGSGALPLESHELRVASVGEGGGIPAGGGAKPCSPRKIKILYKGAPGWLSR